MCNRVKRAVTIVPNNYVTQTQWFRWKRCYSRFGEKQKDCWIWAKLSYYSLWLGLIQTATYWHTFHDSPSRVQRANSPQVDDSSLEPAGKHKPRFFSSLQKLMCGNLFLHFSFEADSPLVPLLMLPIRWVETFLLWIRPVVRWRTTSLEGPSLKVRTHKFHVNLRDSLRVIVFVFVFLI